MAGVKEIRRRIRAVTNTKQITKAMELVAAAKLRKAQERVVAARPYALQLRTVLGRLATAGPAPAGPAEPARPVTITRRAERAAGDQAAGGGEQAAARAVAAEPVAPHPLMAAREAERVAYVVITGDRGLAGAYNTNIIRRASQEVSRDGRDVRLVPVGRKARDHFRKRGSEFLVEYVGVGDEAGMAEARVMARRLMEAFLNREVDEVRLVYTEFFSALNQRPQVVKLLPVEPPPEEAGGPRGAAEQDEYIYEPAPDDVLRQLLPRYVEMLVYHVLLEAKASEHGARMAAMRSATDNSSELIEELTQDFNRARQASITKELMDIVGGAEALKQ